MLKDFKEFALRGNVLDLAIGVIIGAAFGKIVSSFVDDILMPPLGMLIGRVDFASLFINLSGQPVASLDAARKAGVPVIAYGSFINTVISFLIVAFVVFLVVRQINRSRARQPLTPTSKECNFCATSIPLKATRCPACTSTLA